MPHPAGPYRTLRLTETAESTPGHYQVEVVLEGAGPTQRTTVPLELELTAHDRERIRWYLEDYLLFPHLGRKQLAANPQREIGFDPVPLQDWCVPVVYEAERLPLFPEPPSKPPVKLDLGKGEGAAAPERWSGCRRRRTWGSSGGTRRCWRWTGRSTGTRSCCSTPTRGAGRRARRRSSRGGTRGPAGWRGRCCGRASSGGRR